MMAMMGAMAAMSSVTHGTYTGSNGNPYSPPPMTPDQSDMYKNDNSNQLHPFVIRGKTIMARNKKQALKKANSH
ncbi:hypothetical protein CLV58_109123 [Spirosoma oryzae]|uniref:Uncharacterized protein n=2 Tax=Spirosoma oryzae TaxID=1469603 RepID=A0A2T0SYA4_9BACT|nr:hypothetical protein CLV58_109123 [Spirosoma oryzae]